MTTPMLREAATVMLVRDAADGDGIEVFMLRRNLNSDFVGGAYVFPGGKIDDADRDDEALGELCPGLDDAAASERLGVERGGLAYWVAAIRECFEEAGVLLARRAIGGGYPPFVEHDVIERFDTHRTAVYDGDRRLADVCRSEGLELAVADLEYFSHWITPVGPPRRFDTRFFVAVAPPEQTPLHDGGETVASTWIRPHEALERQRAGEFEMILPTIANLTAIADHRRADDVLAAARGLTDIPEILPVIVPGDGPPTVLMPGDDGYAAALAAEAS